jgi:hypothetical protein
VFESCRLFVKLIDFKNNASSITDGNMIVAEHIYTRTGGPETDVGEYKNLLGMWTAVSTRPINDMGVVNDTLFKSTLVFTNQKRCMVIGTGIQDGISGKYSLSFTKNYSNGLTIDVAADFGIRDEISRGHGWIDGDRLYIVETFYTLGGQLMTQMICYEKHTLA